MAEEELPEELNKLEIAPTQPQRKLVDAEIPVFLNPFYDDGTNQECSSSAAAIYKGVLGATQALSNSDCRQRSSIFRQVPLRRRGCNSDEAKAHSSFYASTDASEELTTADAIARVKKQPLKKTGHSGGRRIMLREPILRVLQDSLQTQATAKGRTRCCGVGGGGGSGGNPLTLDKKPTLSCSVSDDATSLSGTVAADVGAMFSNVDLNNSLSRLCLCGRQSDNGHCPDANMQRVPCSYSGQTVGVELAVPITRFNTSSCSLQAASTQQSGHGHATSIASTDSGNTNDDVTIDELASYFDTLVHIPKKMSSMAEMMYI